MEDKVKVEIGDTRFELPIVGGTEGYPGIDISKLHKLSGCYTFDNGFSNTASCLSSITYVDGEQGVLRYRGYDIEDLAENCSFVETAYLLVHGSLPTPTELKEFRIHLTRHSLIHENMHHFFNGFPAGAHPMSIMASMMASLSSFYPEISQDDPVFDITAARLISKVRTLAAFSYKKSLGEPLVYPRYDLTYTENFLNMMFSSQVHPYDLNPVAVDALNKCMILHADHEQNCSTTAVRLVGSARANLYAAISAGICALWGPLHGGANQGVIEMLESMKNDSGNIKKYIERAKQKDVKYRLMGFGHAVYKSYDPRAKILKKTCHELLASLKVTDPLLDIAQELEQAVLSDDYFAQRKLYPNVDFYSGIIYRALGFPTNMLTVLFTIGRLPGWIAHWKETIDNPDARIYRPRQIYIGPQARGFVPLEQRKEREAQKETPAQVSA